MLLSDYIQRICWILEKIVDWQEEDMKTSEYCIMEKIYSKYQIVDIELLELLKMVMSHDIIDILILVWVSNFTTFSGLIDK